MRVWLAMMLLLAGCSPVPEFSPAELKPGGEATAKRVSDRSLIQYPANLPLEAQLPLWTGFSFFRDPWVVAPASTTDRDGLGPHFNARSCITCHHNGGRGPEAQEGVTRPKGLLLRLGSEAGTDDPVYGGQLQTFAINYRHGSRLLQPEGAVSLRYDSVRGHYGDGSEYSLRRPSWQAVSLGHGRLSEATLVSPRLGPHLIGMGLLEAIPEQQLLALEDADDIDGDGISGRYNRVPDWKRGALALGRFGFKGLHPTVEQQTAAAFAGDMGITNPLALSAQCPSGDVGCQEAAVIEGTAPEIPAKLFNEVVAMTANLAPPPARNLTGEVQQRGRALFYQAGCQGCHRPSFTTDSECSPSHLAGQTIWPYTDLALHDMGPDLADGKGEFEASGREWRTAPLWGLGALAQMQSKARYLHDGRARTLEEAILWHGGEGEASRDEFKQMSREERKALLAFLRAI